jgi:hypothetical protein
MLRALISGAADPLDWREVVLSYKNAYTLARRLASTMWLIPENIPVYSDSLRAYLFFFSPKWLNIDQVRDL